MLDDSCGECLADWSSDGRLNNNRLLLSDRHDGIFIYVLSEIREKLQIGSRWILVEYRNGSALFACILSGAGG